MPRRFGARRLGHGRDAGRIGEQFVETRLQMVGMIAEIMRPFPEQEGNLQVGAFHQRRRPAGHRLEKAHIGLAADGPVEHQPAAAEHFEIVAIEGLAQVDRTRTGPAGQARQQAVALAMEAGVEVAAEGNVQGTGEPQVAEDGGIMAEEGLMEDVGDSRPAQQTVPRPIGEAEIE
jgi:hypothetical protein